MMKMKKTFLCLSILILLFFIGVIVLFQLPVEAQEFVPVPSDQVKFSVEEGKIYSFPWIENVDCTKLVVGCFKVVFIDKDSIIIEHPAFESAYSLKSYGWNLFTTIDKDGVWYKLYKFGKGVDEEWVYAVRDEIGLTFLKLPGSSTSKAVIYRFINIDLESRQMTDTYVVESEEPITLFASADVEKIIPKAFIRSVEVNGNVVSFSYDKIMNLNLPSGKNAITVKLDLGQVETLELSPIYEPRNMSLPKEINLDVKRYYIFEIELATIGIPNEVWEESDILLFSDPEPISVDDYPLKKRFEFDKNAVTIKTKATIQYEGRSYPVIVRIENG